MHYSLMQEGVIQWGAILFILLIVFVDILLIAKIVRIRRRQIEQQRQFEKDMAQIDAWNKEADDLIALLEKTEDEAERLKIEEQLSALFQKVIDKL